MEHHKSYLVCCHGAAVRSSNLEGAAKAKATTWVAVATIPGSRETLMAVRSQPARRIRTPFQRESTTISRITRLHYFIAVTNLALSVGVDSFGGRQAVSHTVRCSQAPTLKVTCLNCRLRRSLLYES